MSNNEGGIMAEQLREVSRMKTLQGAINGAHTILYGIKMSLGMKPDGGENMPRPSHNAEVLDIIECLTDSALLLSKDLEEVQRVVGEAMKMLSVRSK